MIILSLFAFVNVDGGDFFVYNVFITEGSLNGMARRKRKEPYMGRILVFAGLCMKILQLLGAALSLEPLKGSTATLITTCLLVGGLAVLAIENMNAVGAFSLLSLVGVIGGMFPTESRVLGFVFLAVTFAGFSAMLVAMNRKKRTPAAAVIAALVIFLALHIFGALQLHVALLTLILVLTYAAMGIGLFLK